MSQMFAWIWLIASYVHGFSLHVVQDEVQSVLHEQQQRESKAHFLQRKRAHTATTVTPPSFYYTSDGIETQLQGLTANCPRKDVHVHVVAETATQDGHADVSLTVVRVWTTPKQGAAAKKKMLLVANEHARELITGDSCVYTVKALCDQAEIASEVRQDAGIALEHTNFTLICNANPTQRPTVENGSNDCRRTNSNGVDLNRNFGQTWEKSKATDPAETYSGTHEFSEPESRIIRDVALKNPPDVFLSVHSGTVAVLATDAFTRQAAKETRKRAKELGLAQNLARRTCGTCKHGDASDILYVAHGTDMDYMYKQFCAFSLTVEIWGSAIPASSMNDSSSKQRLNHVSGLRFHQHSVKNLRGRHVRGRHARSRHVHSEQESKKTSCFAMFNPENKADYDDTMTKWTKAYFEYAGDVAKDEDADAGCESQ